MSLTILKLSLLCVLALNTLGYAFKWNKFGELTSHFKPQYALAAATCLLFFSIRAEGRWAALAALILAINLAAVLPWYVGKRPLMGGKRLKLLLANVNNRNADYARLLAIVQKHSPDVVIAQETSSAWCEALQALQSAYLFAESHPRSEGSGMALYSRWDFERVSVNFPESDARPSLLLKLSFENTPIWLMCLHPRAPIQRGHFELRNEVFAAAARELSQQQDAKICIGDFNITPWSAYYQRFVAQTQLHDVRKGFGLLASWPYVGLGGWFMIPLDHCLVSEDIRVISVQTGEAIGSDHLPLLVELEVPALRQ